MFENITVWDHKKLVNIWEDENLVIRQEIEIISKTTYFFKKESELLDKSINESENIISKCVLQLIRIFFSLISTIFKLFLQVTRTLVHIISAIAKSLLYVIPFVIIQIGIWFIIMVVNFLKFIWKLIDSLFIIFLEFMWKLIDSLFVKIKNASVKHAIKIAIIKRK